MINISEKQMGYASPDYADSFAEFGERIHLKHSDGYLLKRQIGETGLYDACGIYPLFCCLNWTELKKDLDELPSDIVSVGLVANPFGEYSEAVLKEAFEHVNPYKKHYVVDLTGDPSAIGSRHHRRTAQKARDQLSIEVCADPDAFVDTWEGLYETLRQRYSIEGIRAFSHEAFRRQLSMSEIVVHQAVYEDEIIGAQLFFCQEDRVAHCHLGAVSEIGYDLGAFYALDQFSFEYFSGKVRAVDLGGGVGIHTDEGDGLCFYKRGWSSHRQPVYFCGRIINREHYDQLVRDTGTEQSDFFPAYRDGEYA